MCNEVRVVNFLNEQKAISTLASVSSIVVELEFRPPETGCDLDMRNVHFGIGHLQ